MKFQRKTILPTRNFYLATISILAVWGCSSDSSPPVSDLQQGRIVETAVAGMAYSTNSQSGSTDSNGAFSFRSGETVTFSIGDLEVATVPAQATINWFELGGLSDIPVGAAGIEGALYDDTDADGDGVYDDPSLSRVAAIASLLTTLDQDRDSSNGIEIASDVAALITTDLDIRLEYATSLIYHAPFKRMLRQAAQNGVIPARSPRHGALEVQALYERLDIDSNNMNSTRRSSDNNADGTIDSQRLLTYDVDTGRVIGDDYDTNANGLINNAYILSYDDEMRSALYSTDIGNDGIESTRDWEYDAFGDLVRYEQRSNNALFQIETRQLDPGTGLYTRREVINPTNSVHTIETWTMDGMGNRPLATIDRDGDGIPESVITLTYDAPNSAWTGLQDDTNGDGQADSSITRTFNAVGFLTRLERDDDADGSADYVQEIDYDGMNRQIRDAIDNDNDGIFDSVNLWVRNSRGLVTSSRRELGGIVTFTDTATYDADGRRINYAADRDGDGMDDDRNLDSYDSNGNRVESSVDNGADGVLDSVTVYEYDNDGRLLETRTDSGADGTIDFSTVRNYNADGYIQTVERYRAGALRSVSQYLDYIEMSIASVF